MESVRSKVIGIGGAGSNAIRELLRQPNRFISYAVIDTDIKSLQSVEVEEKLMVGHSVTRGLSSGGDPALALKAAESDKEKIEALIQNVDLLFLVVGLAGGVGSSLSSLIAELAFKQGTLVIAIAILPFTIEGGHKHQLAQKNLGLLRLVSHATITLPNDLILQNLPSEATVAEAFQHANSWVSRAVHSVTNMLYKPGIINLDFAALKKVFQMSGGQTLFGIGKWQGVDFISNALNDLTFCPLLHIPNASQRADSLLINITGGRNLSLQDVNHIGSFLTSHFNSKDNTIIGAIIDESLENFVEIVTIGVTDINKGSLRSSQRNRSKPESFQHPQQQFLFDDLPPVSNNKKRKTTKKHIAGDPTDFDDSGCQRGYFGQTERILINGEDIDIPTYLRRGINISI